MSNNDNGSSMKGCPSIYICILTHNAGHYVKVTLDTLSKRLQGISEYRKPYIAVLDNDSKWKTRVLLLVYRITGKINKLIYSPTNLLFAGGNNKLVKSLPPAQKNDLVLLLNSDVEIRSDDWLSHLVHIIDSSPKIGAVSYGVCLDDPVRADGYCILIWRHLYDKFKMDEDFQWFWSMTKLEAKILQAGYDIIAIEEHENMIHHFGGKSGTDWQGAKGMNVERDEVLSWFNNSSDTGRVIVKAT